MRAAIRHHFIIIPKTLRKKFEHQNIHCYSLLPKIAIWKKTCRDWKKHNANNSYNIIYPCFLGVICPPSLCKTKTPPFYSKMFFLLHRFVFSIASIRSPNELLFRDPHRSTSIQFAWIFIISAKKLSSFLSSLDLSIRCLVIVTARCDEISNQIFGNFCLFRCLKILIKMETPNRWKCQRKAPFNTLIQSNPFNFSPNIKGNECY